MARTAPNPAELATLRAITYRISSTPTTQLPQQVPAITAILANCKTLLSSTPASASQSSSEASVAIHKYRTLLSTLLQDRTIQGRWTAIVLIKATLEVGGWETLQKCLPWVRGLLGILSKPDPSTSKKLCLITLTRIFVLTRDYPTLVREITTPSLPAYIQACLQLMSSRPPIALLETILESFNQLLPRHPTLFRTYLKQLHGSLGQIMAPTPSSKLSREQIKGPRFETSRQASEAARRLFVQSPSCVPKGASSEEWGKMVRDLVANVHRIGDKVFRAVIEDWQSSFGASANNSNTFDDEVQDLAVDSMHLSPWSGIYAGGERLVGLLKLVKNCLACPTPNPVHLQVGLIMDLLTRIFSLTVPAAGGSNSITNNVRFNNQVSKEERENLWIILPQVHVEALEIFNALASRFDSISGLDNSVLDQLVWVFSCEKNDINIRANCYTALAGLLSRSGATLPKPSVDSFGPIIRRCCEDILPMESTTLKATVLSAKDKSNATKQQQSSTNADSFLNSSLASKKSTANHPGLTEAASKLLPVLLSTIPAQHFSDSLRTRMDRTAILTRHKDAMMASVLNPPPSKKFGKPAASILPLLARCFPGDAEVESLLRPRMPVVRTGRQNGEAELDDEVDEDEEDQGSEAEAGTEDEQAAEQKDNANEDDIMTDVPTVPAHSSLVEQPASIGPSVVPDAEAPSAASAASAASASSATKRLQSQDATPSPAKRVKMSEEAEVEPVALVVPPTFTPSVVQPKQPVDAPMSVPVPVAEGSSDEDDDFGELVMGQDSDEEE